MSIYPKFPPFSGYAACAFMMIPQDELIMDSAGAYSEVAKNDAIYKAIGINYSAGVMYPHAQVTFVRKDGTRRFDTGVISRHDPDDPD